MTALRVILVIVWMPAQMLGLAVGGFAMLGAQYGQQGTAALGVVLMAAPIVIAGGALWLSAHAAPPTARLILIGGLVLLAGEIAAVLLSIYGARPA